MSIDLGAAYRAARLRISDLVNDDVAAVRVPATPLWDVHDVVAHVTGVVDDALSGNMAGVTTDPWTAAQVERGRGRSVAEMIAGWHEKAPFVEAVLSSPEGASRAAAVFDVHTHECDLLAALGHPIAVPAEVAAWIGTEFRASFDQAVAAAGLPPVSVEADDVEWFRSRLGRRTLDEVRGLRWSADPGPYLDHWFIFGVAAAPLGERPEA
ncbi:MAG: hypothetical protein ACK5CE_16890 [Actinomycetes bacterium]|jgi:hypothetical protein